jgi:predicted metal-dependent hydrolase
MSAASGGRRNDGRDRDTAGRARNARPRDGLGRPLPYGTDGVERQPEGVVRSPEETVTEAQALLDAGKPFHAHEVFEDAWKSGPEGERTLWRGLAQLAVGLTHAARGNTTGGARLLRRGAGAVEEWAAGAGGRDRPHELDLAELASWARELATVVEREGAAISAVACAPRLRGRRD